jgi:hypothetical protein
MPFLRQCLAVLVAVALWSENAAAAGAPPDPQARLDRRKIHWQTLPVPASAEARGLIRAGQGGRPAYDAKAANRLGISAFLSAFGEEAALAAPVIALLPGSSVLGDIGMLLGMAQLNVDLHTNAETAKLSFLKSGVFYLAGKLGWATMEISVIGVGFVDLALTKIGQSALGTKQRVLQSAFYNYHEKGPGRMTYKKWYAYLREQNVRNTEEMYAAIRRKLRVFWTKGHANVRDYADMRQVKEDRKSVV